MTRGDDAPAPIPPGLLTPEEQRDPAIVRSMRALVDEVERETELHETAHEQVAAALGIRWARTSWRTGEVTGTAWERAVAAAAGVVWDRRYANPRCETASREDQAALDLCAAEGVDVSSALMQAGLTLREADVRRVVDERMGPA